MKKTAMTGRSSVLRFEIWLRRIIIKDLVGCGSSVLGQDMFEIKDMLPKDMLQIKDDSDFSSNFGSGFSSGVVFHFDSGFWCRF